MNNEDKRRAAIGLRIRRERIIWNLTQEELSRILGISSNYLGQIERGTRELSRKMEDRLCETFNLSREDFYQGIPQHSWVSMTNESGVIFYDLSEEDLRRLLHSCTPEELQLCGHMIRSLLHYLHNPASRGQFIPRTEPGADRKAEADPEEHHFARFPAPKREPADLRKTASR